VGRGLISAILGTELPGPVRSISAASLHPPGGRRRHHHGLRHRRAKRAEHHVIVLDCTCVNQKGETVISSQAEVKAPTEKVSRPRMPLPDVRIASPTASAS
jgi:phosphate butyryltransferase